jgi:hypothetical protein
LAEPPPSHFWSSEFIAELDRVVPFPIPLPDVPSTKESVIVRTGQPVPRFGIYEPQVEDGGMNYLLEGAPAPMALDPEDDLRPAVWRLIWEDTRYRDGMIPDEENLYFRPTEAPRPAPAVHIDTDPVISLESSKRASRAGVWVIAHRLNVRRRFELGEILPQHDGRDVVWLWVSKD